jgi:uncharacterized membrane protein
MDYTFSFLGLHVEIWVLIAVLSSFLFASENHIEEFLLSRVGKNTASEENEESDPVGILVIISGCFGLIIAGVFWAASWFNGSSFNTGTDLIAQSLLIGALDIAWIIPYLYAIRRSGALGAAPLFQTIPVIALFLGMIAFGEFPPIVEIAGAFVIVGGGILLNLVQVEGRWKVDKETIALMLLSSAIIALVSFLFKDAALEGNFTATGFWGGIGMFLGGVIVFVGRRPYREEFLVYCRDINRTDIAIQATNEVVDVAAMALQRFALIIGPSVMAVEAMNAYQPLFILLISIILAKSGQDQHKETLRGNKFYLKTVAVLLIVAGTVLIT